jgi:hypothetical protein
MRPGEWSIREPSVLVDVAASAGEQNKMELIISSGSISKYVAIDDPLRFPRSGCPNAGPNKLAARVQPPAHLNTPRQAGKGVNRAFVNRRSDSWLAMTEALDSTGYVRLGADNGTG